MVHFFSPSLYINTYTYTNFQNPITTLAIATTSRNQQPLVAVSNYLLQIATTCCNQQPIVAINNHLFLHNYICCNQLVAGIFESLMMSRPEVKTEEGYSADIYLHSPGMSALYPSSGFSSGNKKAPLSFCIQGLFIKKKIEQRQEDYLTPTNNGKKTVIFQHK